MQKSGSCSCGATITLPNSECLYECRTCHTHGVFLCHPLEVTDPMLIRCRQCKQVYSMFSCPDCEGHAVMNNYRPGHTYGCLCGFTATFLTCNRCTALLSLPPGKNYEGTNIKCKKCSNQFKYRLCNQCGECNYSKPGQNGDEICFNEKCGRSLSLKQSQKVGKGVFIEPNTKQRKWNVCRVCGQSQAEMVNSQCLHLAVCVQCLQRQPNQPCPVCREPGTSYHRVRLA